MYGFWRWRKNTPPKDYTNKINHPYKTTPKPRKITADSSINEINFECTRAIEYALMHSPQTDKHTTQSPIARQESLRGDQAQQQHDGALNQNHARAREGGRKMLYAAVKRVHCARARPAKDNSCLNTHKLILWCCVLNCIISAKEQRPRDVLIRLADSARRSIYNT